MLKPDAGACDPSEAGQPAKNLFRRAENSPKVTAVKVSEPGWPVKT